MKSLFKFVLLLILPLLFVNCGDEDDDGELVICNEPVNELKLSLDNKPCYVYSIDTTFTIVQGNDSYSSTVSDENVAKVSIQDTTVHVSFIANGSVTITIKDAYGQSADVNMSVYHPSLVETFYGLFMEIDTTHTSELRFGAGGYHIENVKGDCVAVSIVDDRLVTQAKDYGKVTFDIVDKRGTRLKTEVCVVAHYDLDSDRLDIEMKTDQIASVRILYGAGGWKVEPYDESLCEVNVLPAGNAMDYDVIQIDTKPEALGNSIMQFRDNEGNTATIHLTVRE